MVVLGLLLCAGTTIPQQESATADDATQPVIQRIAGTGDDSGTFADGGSALASSLVASDVAPTADGGYLLADALHHRIRKVDANGLIVTVAGNGVGDGDGVPVVGAQATATPAGLVRAVESLPGGGFVFSTHSFLDGSDGIYAVDSAGVVSKLSDDAATSISYAGDGVLLWAATQLHLVKRRAADGTVTVVAGGGGSYAGENVPATTTALRLPYGVSALAGGGFLIADSDNFRVRAVDPDGNIRTAAGGGRTLASQAEGLPATSVSLPQTYSVDPLPGGGFVIKVSDNVFTVDAAGTFHILAGRFGGGGEPCDGANALRASFHGVGAVEALDDGSVLVADGYGGVRRIQAGPVTRRPDLSLSGPAKALTGAPTTFGASTDTCVAVASFAWDTDGNGSFETGTGTTPSVSTTFSTPGDHTVGVRVTNTAGLSTSTSRTVRVLPSPPPGEIGLSVDDEAIYTNTREVTLSPVWPDYATQALVANDGGFRHAQRLPLGAAIPWTLSAVNPGDTKLTKVVYVRFLGVGQDTLTYTDDIVLDQVAPTVTSASPVTGAARAAGRRVLVVKARDNRSGVKYLQLTTNKKKPGKLVKFKQRIPLTAGRVHYVRVRDGAGNYSHWRKVVSPARG